jgi:hypothetical protein
MRTSIQIDHHALVEKLRRVLEGPGETPPAVRQQAAKTASGVQPVPHVDAVGSVPPRPP